MAYKNSHLFGLGALLVGTGLIMSCQYLSNNQPKKETPIQTQSAQNKKYEKKDSEFKNESVQTLEEKLELTPEEAKKVNNSLEYYEFLKDKEEYKQLDDDDKMRLLILSYSFKDGKKTFETCLDDKKFKCYYNSQRTEDIQKASSLISSLKKKKYDQSGLADRIFLYEVITNRYSEKDIKKIIEDNNKLQEKSLAIGLGKGIGEILSIIYAPLIKSLEDRNR